MSVLCPGTQTGHRESHAASVSHFPPPLPPLMLSVSWEAGQELGPHADGQDLDNNPSLEPRSPTNNIITKEKVLTLLSDSHI